MAREIAVVILAAGQGTRMKSARSKVLHEIGGLSMLGHVMAAAAVLEPARMTVVVGDHAPDVADHARRLRGDIVVAVQSPPRGTGDAVAKATPSLDGFRGVVLILYADTPLIAAPTLRRLADRAASSTGAVLGFSPSDPGGYGRLILDGDGALAAIVEAKDASETERTIRLCNSGVMAVDAAFLSRALPKLTPNNAKGEYYLTDIVAISCAEGKPFAVVESGADEVLGVNSRAELAEAEAAFQTRARREAMDAGATLIDPGSVYFAHDTQLGRDVVVEPGVFFGPGVVVEEGATIRAYSHLEGARIGKGSIVGPFARLRPGAVLAEDCRVGNFVEVKKSSLARGAKANHLAYLGDASVGEGANIGAGVITCNYDGYRKHRTEIGAGAFIGSNSSLVAPATIGEGAYVGSGSVITKPVAPGDLAVARGRQAEIKGWAEKFRRANADKKKPSE